MTMLKRGMDSFWCLFGGVGSEVEVDGGGGGEAAVGEAERLVALAVDFNAADVGIVGGRAVGAYDERVRAVVARVETQRHLGERRGGQRVLRRTRAVGIEAHHAEHRPGRHRSRVVVARYAVRRVAVVAGEQVADGLLRAPFLSREVAEQVGVSDVRLVGRVV